MERKVALITGITGQDGSFLAEFLLEKVMTYTVLFAARQWTSANVSHIWKANRIFTCTMQI
ncbi:GDP-mannose 4,6-dehydratase [Phocaeicola plebeius]|uniref:GDP-mannose 4,6-dehydratase n=1 Tax=Phocaeicola plebeius TaxID=310297 RepID=UPI003DA9DB18